jgi:cytochrome b subunit of formate dehydrogenase
MNKKMNKWLLIVITTILAIAGIFMFIENQKLNRQIDQEIEEFYSK